MIIACAGGGREGIGHRHKLLERVKIGESKLTRKF